MGKIQIFIGKGGVGKSTCSSLFALRHQEEGERTLLNSLDPAHNLHDIFQCSLSSKEKKVAPFLYVREADMEKIQKAYMKDLKRELSGIYHYKQAVNVEKYFQILKFSPGMEEYTAWLALETCYKEKNYDRIVIDTPPTALTLKTLALSSVNLHWIARLEQMREEIVEKKNSVSRIRKENQTRLEEDPVFARLQKMKERYKRILTSLQDKEMTEIVLVLNEDELSYSESLKIRDDLKDLSLAPGRVIINKSGNREEWRNRVGEAFPRIPVDRLPREKDSLTGYSRLEGSSRNLESFVPEEV